jgi:hypothetical protein
MYPPQARHTKQSHPRVLLANPNVISFVKSHWETVHFVAAIVPTMEQDNELIALRRKNSTLYAPRQSNRSAPRSR